MKPFNERNKRDIQRNNLTLANRELSRSSEKETKIRRALTEQLN